MNLRPQAIFPLLTWVALLGLLPSCSRTWEMMPTPIVHQQRGERVFRHLDSDDKTSDLRVFYATNRLPQGNGKKPWYGNGVSQDMRVGVNTIRFGKRPIALKTLIKASTRADREDDIPMDLTTVSEQAVITAGDKAAPSSEARAFAAEINRTLDKSRFKKIHIYVHGARSSFFLSSVQGGQFHHFMARDGAFIVVSWPTTQSFLTYKQSVAAADESVQPLVNLLDFLAHNTKAEDINIIAYSAGSRVVAPALAALRKRYPQLNRAQLLSQLKIREAYFAAPDVGTAPFVAEYLPTFYPMVGRTTVTEHSKDLVLKISEMANKSSRLGRADSSEVTEEQIQWLVDAANNKRLDWIDMAFEDGERPVDFKEHAYWYARGDYN
jgi:esterase/lipase superfamily enzyme